MHQYESELGYEYYLDKPASFLRHIGECGSSCIVLAFLYDAEQLVLPRVPEFQDEVRCIECSPLAIYHFALCYSQRGLSEWQGLTLC